MGKYCMPQCLFQYQRLKYIDTYAEIHVPFEKLLKEFLAFTTISGSARITVVSRVIGVAGMELLQCIKRAYCHYYMNAGIQSNFD